MDIYGFIDRIKGLCHVNGLSNQASEEVVVRNLFLYKILCDRNGGTGDDLLIKPGDRITEAGSSPVWLDETFARISGYPENEEKYPDGILQPIMSFVDEMDQGTFYKGILDIFAESASLLLSGDGDYFGTVFEYLIQDYNVASGRYAEYYTPMEISDIIARIVTAGGDQREHLSVYDPSAGTGTLLLALKRQLHDPVVFGQDISQKSMELLQLNFLLQNTNGTARRGNTLSHPYFTGPFDYIVSNPPFKTDFSFIRDDLEKSGDYPFGIPQVPVKKKESMPIYLCFIQHVLRTLSARGRAAIVVPLIFLSTQGEIESAIRRYIIEQRILQGVLVMPKNTFANTGTKVAVVFLDKSGCPEPALLDVSGEGHSVKKGGISRTAFGEEGAEYIVSRFFNEESIRVSYERISEKDGSFLPGAYIDAFAGRKVIDDAEWAVKRAEYSRQLNTLLQQEAYWNTKLLTLISLSEEERGRELWTDTQGLAPKKN